MSRAIIEIPVISDTLRRIGAPVSVLVRTGDMLYTCGMPPIDFRTGEIVRGDIGTQTRAALNALAFTLEFGGSSLEQVVKATVYIADNALAAEMNRSTVPISTTVSPPEPASRSTPGRHSTSKSNVSHLFCKM